MVIERNSYIIKQDTTMTRLLVITFVFWSRPSRPLLDLHIRRGSQPIDICGAGLSHGRSPFVTAIHRRKHARFSQCTTDCHNFTLIRADSGYLTTYVTKEEESTCATRSRCPWRLRVASGQRINVTLMDFNIGKTARKTANTLGMYRKTNCRR
ncbi:hypothetical protein LSAT2_006645 [Lamellibrachia satsuma]|nr:hypothetical protein LSAT2_006645 [Lamellibrachia satsuma]